MKKTIGLYLNNGFVLELVVSITLFFIFRKPVEIYIQKTIIEYLLQYVEPQLWVDFCWFLLCLVVTITFLFNSRLKIKRPKTSFKVAIYLVLVSIIYTCLYRSGNVWDIKSLASVSGIKYTDILILYSAVNAFSWIIHFKKFQSKIESNSGGFFEDHPLGKENEVVDLLGFGPYAVNLAGIILGTFPKRSFVIGINGEWGSGKSSFMHLVKEEINEKAPGLIQIEFNPWESSHSRYIIKDFFEELESNVGAENGSLTKKISEYSDKLMHLETSSILNVISTFLRPKEISVSLLRNQISKILEQSAQRIIVYIDDLDRLDPKELVQVFKLVRNSANFRNVIFLLAYDRNYIDTALSRRVEYREKRFLEKIVQTEVNLPRFSPLILRNELIQEINRIIHSSKLSNEEKKAIEKEVSETINYDDILDSIGAHNILNDYLGNFRDVRRLLNSLLINMSNLLNEVLIQDFLRLELLKLKFPKVYRSLQVNPNELLEKAKNSPQKQYVLKSDVEIRQLLEGWKFEAKEIESIVGFISRIFPEESISSKKDPSNLSVQVFRNYHLYFRYYLDDKDFSESEYRRFKEAGLSIFKEQLNIWVEKGKESRVRERIGLESEYLFATIDEFKTVLEGSIYLASLRSRIYENESVGFHKTDFQYWCLDFGKRISLDLYDGDRVKYKSYIKGLLKTRLQDGFLTLSSFVDKMKEVVSQINLHEDLMFNVKELTEINVYHLNSTLKSFNSYNYVIASLLIQTRDLSNPAKIWWKQIPSNALKSIWNFINQKSLHSQLLISFISREKNPKSVLYSLHDHYLLYFKDKRDFIKYLQNDLEIKKWSCFDEYKGFIEHWFTYETSRPLGSSITYNFSSSFKSECDKFWENYYKDV